MVPGDVLPTHFTCQVWKHIMTSPGSASTYMHILGQRHPVLTLCGSENLYQKVMECEDIFMVHGICLWYIFTSRDIWILPKCRQVVFSIVYDFHESVGRSTIFSAEVNTYFHY